LAAVAIKYQKNIRRWSYSLQLQWIIRNIKKYTWGSRII